MKRVQALAAGLLFLGAGVSYAAELNLTTKGSSGTINGALFQQTNNQPTGTGKIDSFVQVGVGGNDNVIQAYNTTHNVLNNGSSAVFNHALLLSDVPIVDVGGTDYRQFLLDINQDSKHPLESLDEIQVFQSTLPNQSVTTFTGTGVLQLADSSLVYRMNQPGGNYILLDASLGSGSGSGDMFADIPTSDFTNTSDPYVYLYSKFGVEDPNNGGFEEWAVINQPTTTPVPELPTWLLLSAGLPAALTVFRPRLA